MMELPIGWFVSLCCLSVLGIIFLFICLYFVIIEPIIDIVRNYDTYKNECIHNRLKIIQLEQEIEKLKQDQEKEVEEE